MKILNITLITDDKITKSFCIVDAFSQVFDTIMEK